MGSAGSADTLASGSPIHVRKLRADGSQAYAWDGVVLRSDAHGIVLRAQFNVDLVELGFTTFRRGDEFVEFYYFDRWYNVFQISAPDGRLKGWYANVGLPAEVDPEAGVLQYVDLELDVWANPDGRFVVLSANAKPAVFAGDVWITKGGDDTWLRQVEEVIGDPALTSDHTALPAQCGQGARVPFAG